MIATVERSEGCLLGLAAGDAVGTTVEFKARGTFPPVNGIAGGGPFGLQPGQWTDDTSMALCLGMSLLETQGFDPRDQIERYVRWWQEGYLSSTGQCFDIGHTVRSALAHYQRTGEPFAGSTHPRSAGNGSLMRLAPVAIFYYPDVEKIIHYCGESSRTTHGAAECVDACRYFGVILHRALAGGSKPDILAGWPEGGRLSPAVAEIAAGRYLAKGAAEIVGSGYVIKSLEAALWCFSQTRSFEAAILMAANLGDDADTTAAVCGQVAGAFYGREGIPKRWQKKLFMREVIRRLARELGQFSPSR